MVRYRDAISIIVVTIMIFSAFPICVSDSSDAVGMTNDGILLFELDPKDAADGIALLFFTTYPSISMAFEL